MRGEGKAELEGVGSGVGRNGWLMLFELDEE